MKQLVTLHVNGEDHELALAPHRTLLDVLREDLGLIGAKRGCDTGECGACTVLIDGKPMTSCLVLAVTARGKRIETVESMAQDGQLHPLQQSFIDHGAVQCGFCTPGMLLVGKTLLEQNPNPSEEEIRTAIAGNICRCTGYIKIVEAIRATGQNQAAAAVPAGQAAGGPDKTR